MQSFKTTHTLVLSGLHIARLLLGNVVGEAFAASGIFAYTGSLNTARYDHTATLLPTGEVLVVGDLGVNGSYTSLASAELYDPQKGKLTATGTMSVGRTAFTATLLPNRQVLVAGGYSNTGNNNPNTYLTSAELFNSSTGAWSLTTSMSPGAGLPTTPVLLSDGDMLIANDAQFYIPNTASWAVTGALPAVAGAPTKATILGNGNALGTGCECKSTKYYNCHFVPTATAYLYSFSGNTWSQTGSMNFPLFSQMMTLLPSGEVLVVGGNYGIYRTPLSSAELYTP